MTSNPAEWQNCRQTMVFKCNRVFTMKSLIEYVLDPQVNAAMDTFPRDIVTAYFWAFLTHRNNALAYLTHDTIQLRAGGSTINRNQYLQGAAFMTGGGGEKEPRLLGVYRGRLHPTGSVVGNNLVLSVGWENLDSSSSSPADAAVDLFLSTLGRLRPTLDRGAAARSLLELREGVLEAQVFDQALRLLNEIIERILTNHLNFREIRVYGEGLGAACAVILSDVLSNPQVLVFKGSVRCCVLSCPPVFKVDCSINYRLVNDETFAYYHVYTPEDQARRVQSTHAQRRAHLQHLIGRTNTELNACTPLARIKEGRGMHLPVYYRVSDLLGHIRGGGGGGGNFVGIRTTHRTPHDMTICDPKSETDRTVCIFE